MPAATIGNAYPLILGLGGNYLFDKAGVDGLEIRDTPDQ
jgi:hypothetical protein